MSRGLCMKEAIVEIDPLWEEIAEDSPEVLSHRSVNKKSYATGVIGELAVSQALSSLGIDYSHEDEYDYDFISNGVKIDVKTNHHKYKAATFDTNLILTDYLRNQKCDAYIFAATCGKDNLVRIMGCCAKFWFWQNDQGLDKKAGDIIFVNPLKQDARLMQYKSLTSIYELPLLLEALR